MNFVKPKRTNLERQKLYTTLKMFGVNVPLIRRMRDWTYSHIRLFLKSNQYGDYDIKYIVTGIRTKKRKKRNG